MKNHILAPSLLAADFCELGSAVERIERVPRAWIHFDVMDGHFVPEISFGTPILESVRKRTKLPLDVHLMTKEPERFVDSFARAGADHLTFHYEACTHCHRLISHIHSLGKKAGVSIVPSTPLMVLEEILPLVDLVLVMTVNPGYGGQKLIPSCLDKIRRLKEMRERTGGLWLIEADGGINADTIDSVYECGVDVAVSGTAFFSGSLIQAEALTV